MKKLFALGLAGISTAAMLFEGIGAGAWAGEAVSGLNGKVSGLYGGVDGDEAAAAEGSISTPLGNRFGFQADGLVGDIDSESIHGIGGHLFWRNPQLALLGLAGSWAEHGDFEVNRAGLEGEYYLDQFTFAAALGQQGGDLDDAAYGGAEVRFYPLGDLMLAAAWSRADERNRYGAGAEYQLPSTRLSVFGQVALGDDDYEHVFGGLRFYLGGLKSLGRRHREDDPPSMLLQSLTANLGAAQAAALPAAAPATLPLADTTPPRDATPPPAPAPQPTLDPPTATDPAPAPAPAPPSTSPDDDERNQETTPPGNDPGEDDDENDAKEEDGKKGKDPKDK